MSVRKRVWLWAVEYENRKGKRLTKEFKNAEDADEFAKEAGSTAEPVRWAWLVDYRDGAGVRRFKTFKKKGDADNWASKTRIAVNEGTHVPDSASITIGEACDYWLKTCKGNNLEASTLAQYHQHVNLHIKPLLGAQRLSRFGVPSVRHFADRLGEEGVPQHPRPCSSAMVRAVLASLGSILADAQERGFVARNVVRERPRRRRSHGQGNGRKKLRVGVDIPTPQEMRQILHEARNNLRRHISILVLATTGLRASEFRGLRWEDLKLDKNRPELQVRVRADLHNKLGPPKSNAGTRTIPLGERTAGGLRQWQKKCPKMNGKLLYVFPNGRGNIEGTVNIVGRLWQPAQIAAGITTPALDEKGEPMRDDDGKLIVRARYSGLHALRHYFASMCINRKADGGLELPGKVIQERLGHASITMTMDTYGHLFPRGDDKAELALAEKMLLG